MKKLILHLEKSVLDFVLFGGLVWMFSKFAFRIMWLWGRIRFGALVRNRGSGWVCAWNADLRYPENMVLGDSVVIGTNVSIGAHSCVELGNNVRILRDVLIETAGLNFPDMDSPYQHVSKPIRIENGAWIGARAIILGGVQIGENAVFAAGSVAFCTVPERDTVAGIPARPVKNRI
ncbi:acyltransferase [Roseobacter sp. CCS2]|uniref:acyltransferase n=1 Tax=Roseobacter sp. CCS2 TaxID=391593 RepID=UPI0000F40422|nr:acyltransferase [Roseobacter sp. CCS2]EBA13971.1 Acetyltransferase (isoleucine patch superfamily)-like protein [Roseobacter sp. CCS2]